MYRVRYLYNVHQTRSKAEGEFGNYIKYQTPLTCNKSLSNFRHGFVNYYYYY
jgi:hypothetical protein